MSQGTLSAVEIVGALKQLEATRTAADVGCELIDSKSFALHRCSDLLVLTLRMDGRLRTSPICQRPRPNARIL